MMELLAFLACTLLAALAIFQVLLIFGAPLGHYAWGGNYAILPAKLRISSVVSIILYATFAVIILGSAGLLELPVSKSILDIGIWILAAYFGIGIIMNGISRSKRERLAMTPIAAILAFTCLFIAMN